MSDLKKVNPLTYAGYPACPTRITCLLGMKQIYGLNQIKFIPIGKHQRLHAARPEQGGRRGRLLDRPGAAQPQEVHGAGRRQAHLRLPERRAGHQEDTDHRTERGVARQHRERSVGEADAPGDAGDEQGVLRRQGDADGDRSRFPGRERAAQQVVKVVVLGGGSTGEHFVGALRRFDDEAQITLVESRLVGGECSYFACMPTKTHAAGDRARRLARAGAGPARRASGAGRRLVVARLDDERLGRRRPAPLPRGVELPARARRGPRRAPRRRGGRRAGAAVRPARPRDRLAAGDPADRRARLRRVLDEPRGDADAQGAAEPRRHGRRPGRRRARAVLLPHGLPGDDRRARRSPAGACPSRRRRADGRAVPGGGDRRPHRRRDREGRAGHPVPPVRRLDARGGAAADRDGTPAERRAARPRASSGSRRRRAGSRSTSGCARPEPTTCGRSAT